jgi:hypothetical protein
MTNADDRRVLDQISELVEEEQRLREQRVGHGLSTGDADRLRAIEERLDQCWDLLRQRRAQEEFGGDPADTAARPVDVVERYRQ